MSRDKWALMDLDGSIADFERAVWDGLKKMASPEEKRLFNSSGGFDRMPSWIKARIRAIKRERGFWRNLPVIDIGLELYHAFQEWGFNTMVVTKAPYSNDEAWTEKAAWCREHIPDAQVTITSHDKGLQMGDILYDDWPNYVLAWLANNPEGKVLMLDGPVNRGFDHPNVLRVTRDPLALQEAVIKEFLGI